MAKEKSVEEKIVEEQPIYPVRLKKENGNYIICVPPDLERAKKSFEQTVGSKFVFAQKDLLAKVTALFDSVEQKNAALQMMFEMGPTNPMESMLAAQIITMNQIIAQKILMLDTSHSNPDREFDELSKIKTLSGIFQKNISLFHKLQHGGKQNIRVQHVNVSEGGQAIIGDVTNEKK
jgi:hypothetical protein